MAELVRTGDDVLSGIKTEDMLEPEREYDRPGFRVTWIEWDSEFRNTDLRIGDLVVGVDGKSLDEFLQPGKQGRAVGQYHETSYWQESGAKPGQEITLQVIRDGQPLDIKGKLHPNYFYYDGEGKNALAPGGPPRLSTSTDRFSSWSGWYEKLVWKMSYILDGAWDWRGINNKKELEEHDEHKERIDYLTATYPGPFSQATLSDWTSVRNILLGKAADDVDLEYREIGAKRAEQAKQEAARAWQEFSGKLAAETVPAFPAVDVDDREKVVGKVVELPWISQREIVNDLGETYAVAGSQSSGYYFIPFSTPALRPFFDAYYRYKTQVNPQLAERYQFTGRIKDDPRMIGFRGSSVTGLVVEVIAGRAGSDGEFFIDLRNLDKPEFAGESAINKFDKVVLSDEASPEQVITAMIQAIKLGDEKTWKSLFANWRVVTLDSKSAIFDGSYVPPSSVLFTAWEHSRRFIMGEVCDARVEKVGRIRRIVSQGQGEGDKWMPAVDEVNVFVDHYGPPDKDGKYRTFVNLYVERRWTLQRLDSGPWRITSVQHL